MSGLINSAGKRPVVVLNPSFFYFVMHRLAHPPQADALPSSFSAILTLRMNSVVNLNTNTMNKQIYLIFFLLGCKICEAQNLIPNSDFEQYTSCPTNYSQLNLCSPWFDPLNLSGSADYYNSCATFAYVSVPNNALGFQQAHSGVAYSGIYLSQTIGTNIREYIEVQLTSPLLTDSCYHLEMYVNLGDNCKYTTDVIGIYFSNTAIQNVGSYAPLPFNPQVNNAVGNVFDTLNWTLVVGNYTAIGGENYLVIGNFKNDATTFYSIVDSTAAPRIYCFIDDVSLIKISSCATGINVEAENSLVNVYPNPMSNKLNIINSTNITSEIILYDITSRKLLQQKFTNTISLNTEQFIKGIYIYEVRNKSGVIKKGKLVKE
ncbi:MAG TPA: T9SS type A sorting domain-containing protein [Bacteroidia bacterium]|nr:T9SS type A sorting domain-containing protein [Bacteroidia bacterium]